MKTRVVLMLAVCSLASGSIVLASEVDILSVLMANPPQAPSVDRQGPTARPASKPVLPKSRVAYRDSRPQTRTVLITPGGTSLSRRSVANQGLRASELRPQPRVSMRPMNGAPVAPNFMPASATRVAKRARVAKRQARVVPAKPTYQRPQQKRPQPLLATTYYQPAPKSYAPQYAQRPAYAAAPNYYQGYAYPGWNSTNPASCGPGRA